VLGASSYFFTKNLNIGATGTDVTELQNLLARLGFYHGAVTGYFGSATAAALRAFQAAHGISQTGTVGPLTRAALNQGTDTAAATSTPAAASLQALIASLLAQVAALQAQLKLQAGH
jgi:peptidoglycan hydrolase-like protein with peptidoglycan-binding domain